MTLSWSTLFNRAGTQRLAGILACPVGRGISLLTVCGREIFYRGIVRCNSHGYGLTYGVAFPAGKAEKDK
ncbi:MAG: hypothetical protein ACYC4A_09780 [Desulfobulbia bacterium]